MKTVRVVVAGRVAAGRVAAGRVASLVAREEAKNVCLAKPICLGAISTRIPLLNGANCRRRRFLLSRNMSKEIFNLVKYSMQGGHLL
jgi:hypothetical protein